LSLAIIKTSFPEGWTKRSLMGFLWGEGLEEDERVGMGYSIYKNLIF
jgi:hypothetical protein